MKKVTFTARVVLGLIFIIMGLNGFFDFFELKPTSLEAQKFIEGLRTNKIFWPVEKSIETFAGLCFFFNRFVPLALDLIGPLLFNILLFHLVLDLSGIALALLATVCFILVLSKYWKSHYLHLFSSRCDQDS